MAAGTHWDAVYRTHAPATVSWYEDDPVRSLESIRSVAPDPGAAIVDVGAGESFLADRLLADGYTDVTVLDVSDVALDQVRARFAGRAPAPHVVRADLLDWVPDRRYDVWHDRAVFHFLVDDADRARYAAVLHTALRPAGHAVLATFAPSGPDRCSGLPAMRYDAGSLLAALGAGFTMVRSETADHATPAGVVQPFTWVVVRRDG